MTTTIVQTIKDQLLALGLNPRAVMFVQWDERSLKVSRGLCGAIITYDRDVDLYDVTMYNGLEISNDVRTGVHAENLLDVVAPALGGEVKASLFDQIRVGDVVTFLTPQNQSRKGRAVMRGPAGWVLNCGGQHGTPAVVDSRNIISVRRKK